MPYSIPGYWQNRRNSLRFRAIDSKGREIISSRNLLIDSYLKYLFNNALHIGTALAELSYNMKFRMKVNLLSTKKLAMLFVAFCAVTLAFSHKANALTIGDSQELGFVDPGLPASDANRTLFVNTMIGLALNGSTHVIIGPHDNLVMRSNNDFGPLPTAVFAQNGNTTTIDLGSGLYSYLYAKYDGPNFGAEVWYVGNLSGMITIPATGGGYGLSGWTLFGPGVTQVPDGGATVMLLGAAFCALGIARRFIMS
jgi:VPDSG-CTERM motif